MLKRRIVPNTAWRRAVTCTLATLTVSLAGCFSVPASPKLLPAEPAPRTLADTAWVDEIEFNDEYAWRGASFADAFLINVRDYIDESAYFHNVKLTPGRIQPEDYILRFTLDEFHQKRRMHPAYVPCAILTLTLYIWFGGPIVIDEVNFDGTLEVSRGDGTFVTKVHDSFREKDSKSLYSEGYVSADIIEERTRFMRSLLDKAAQNIDGGGR